LFQSLAEEAGSEFVNDLDIEDTGATVLATDDPVIEVEILEEVAQPQDVEFAAAFDAVEEIIHDAVMALPKFKFNDFNRTVCLSFVK